MTRITGYAALTAPDTSDVLPIVDVSDTTMAVTGTTKQVTVAALLALGGGGGAGGGITLAGDLGGTSSVPQVIAVHLASALPLTQGGTGGTSAAAALVSLGAASAANLTAETIRATTAESVNTQAVSTETTRALIAEAVNAAAIVQRPATGSQGWLLAALPAITYGSVVRSNSEAALSASVTWPDGTVGTYTADILSAVFPGAVNAFHVTYGGHTVTQPQVTRDSAGAITTQPALTYA